MATGSDARNAYTAEPRVVPSILHINMLLSCVLTLAAFTAAAPTSDSHVDAYVPRSTKCPTSALVRQAMGLNLKEVAYTEKRKCTADASLAAWLEKQGSFCTTNLPVVGLASSGGGQRALLETAGVVQAFDIRESDEKVGGIYQALTYQSALSGQNLMLALWSSYS